MLSRAKNWSVRLCVMLVVCRLEAMDADEGDNARVTYSLSHGNEKALFHVDERTGALTTTRRLPPIQTVYRLLITARDSGSPARLTLLDVDVVVNDSAIAVSHRLTDHPRWTLADDRMFVVLGIMCGVVVVSLLAVVVCVWLVVRRRTAMKRSSQQSHAPAAGALTEDASSTVACRHSVTETTCTTADNCAQLTDHQQLNWHTEYSKMIDVRICGIYACNMLSLSNCLNCR